MYNMHMHKHINTYACMCIDKYMRSYKHTHVVSLQLCCTSHAHVIQMHTYDMHV